MNAVTRTFLIGLLTAVSAAVIVPDVHGDGINGSGRAVSWFHSIVIDGVHYQTDTALIRINGVPVEERDLQVGNRVIIKGDMASLEAWTVDYYETLAGTLSAASVEDEVLQRGELVVMGVTVLTNAETWFHGAELADLQAGMQIAISGSWDRDGSILASSVHAKDLSDEVVTGFVGSVTANGFTIGGVRIDTLYAQNDLDGLDPAIGLLVHVKGEYDADGVFQASEVKIVGVDGIGSETVEIEGFVATDNAGLMLEGHPLVVDADTSYSGGDADDLVPGAKVVVRGTLDAAGILRAIEMEFERSATSRVDGRIEWVDEDTGFIVINGVQIAVDEEVTMRDDRDQDHHFSPDRLSHGDSVSVMVEETNGALRAKKITRKHWQRRLLRARAQGSSFWSGVRAGNRDFGEFFEARKFELDGRDVSRWEMLWKLKQGDEVQLRWGDDGSLESVKASTGSANVWNNDEDDDDEAGD